MRLTKKMVQRALAKDEPWCIGNQVLYDLCRRYPYHTVNAEILAKIWLIGRAYSASIERGRGKAPGAEWPNDRFYTKAVTGALRDPGWTRSSEFWRGQRKLASPQPSWR